MRKWNNRGEGYVEVAISVLLIAFVLVFAVSLASFVALNQNLKTLADGITDYAAAHAGLELQAYLDDLRRQTGLDFTCTFDGTNADADGFVQLGDMIQCKLTCPARLRGFGDFLFPVTLQAESRARSRVYRK